VFGLEIASAVAAPRACSTAFLARRQRRTLAAYTLDIEEVAAFGRKSR
jgi:hypothetical protein